MNSSKPLYELSRYTDLSDVADIELLDLDYKKAENEDVVLDTNYPQWHKGGDVGVLVVHGFTASPMEMLTVVDFLKNNGMSVYQVRIAGHGSKVENLNHTTYKDWYDSARYGYFVLKRNCRKVFVIGESMGGLVALTVAGLNDLDGAILMAPCIRMKSKMTELSPFLSRFVKTMDKKGTDGWSEFTKQIYYDKWPAVGIYQLLMFTRYVREHMELFDFPMLGFQFHNDAVVSGMATKRFFERVPSNDATYVEFPDKNMTTHVLVANDNIYRDEMFETILNWIEKRSK